MGENSSVFIHPQRPVESITWYEAVKFCNKLSEMQGLSPYYQISEEQKDPDNLNEEDNDSFKWLVKINPHAKGYHLPTEAEWEYASKGGKYGVQKPDFAYAGSDNLSEVAWHSVDYGNSHRISQRISLKRSNALGLFDMSGNMLEWCWDWFGKEYYKESPLENPIGPEQGSRRVVRGGSWSNLYNVDFRPAVRFLNSPDSRNHNIGFRLSRY